eukprot:gene5792-7387_t
MCRTSATEPGALSVFISANGQEFIDVGEQYLFVAAPKVVSLYPSVVTNLSTSITLYGSNLQLRSGAQMCCQFTSVGSEVTTAVSIDNNTLSCALPVDSWNKEQKGFVATVSLALNCADYVSTGLTVTRLFTPVVISAAPRLGPSGGDTIVMISGQNIAQTSGGNTVKCRFNSLFVVNATVITSDLVSCVTPSAVLPVNSTELSVSLEVSTDGGNTFYATEQGVFTYITKPVIREIGPLFAVETQSFALYFRGVNFKSSKHDQNRHLEVCRV